MQLHLTNLHLINPIHKKKRANYKMVAINTQITFTNSLMRNHHHFSFRIFIIVYFQNEISKQRGVIDRAKAVRWEGARQKEGSGLWQLEHLLVP